MIIKLFTIFFFSLLFQSLKSSSQILNFIYNGFLDQPSDISLQGIASVTPEGTLKLTNKTVHKTGHAFYTKPIRFKDFPNGTVSSFSTTFVFAINSSDSSIRSGDGFAFVVAPNPNLPFANASQYLGLFNNSNNGNDSNHVFAVEFDTTRSTEFNDTADNHVGININSMKSVNSSTAGYWVNNYRFMSLDLISNGERMQVWVDYDGLTHQTDVSMAPFGKDKPSKPLVSIVRDLSSVLLQDMFVGFSSVTGFYASEHVVFGWSFRVKGKAPPLDLSDIPFFPYEETKSLEIMTWVLFISLFGFPILFFLSMVFLVRCIVRRRRKFAEELEDWETEYAKNRLKFKELYHATKGFKDKNLLGLGGFGSVYKGVMPKTKKKIAVKRVSNKSRQGLKEFVSEIVSLGQMSHRNLLPLLGYCRRKKELILVYDYMPNGSLEKYIHNSQEDQSSVKGNLDWKQRFNVIKGVASALFFLHEEWEQVVIHRDIKASNVLLDEDHNARLGDFGLARLCGHGTLPQTTHVAGTWGYLAPDYIRTGRATRATDVFALGVLLLEVACGKRPIEIRNESGARVLLVDWVFGFWLEGNIMDVKDPNMGSEYDQSEVEMVLKLGLLCSHKDPEARPTMRQVLHYLKGDVVLPDLSPLEFRGSRMMSESHQNEVIYTGEYSIDDSLSFSGR